MGIHNNGMSRGQALSTLTSVAQALIGTGNYNSYRLYQGQCHKRNDQILDARAGHVSYWIHRGELPLATLLEQGTEMVNLALATYDQWVGQGNSLRGQKS
jgi:hypothetical protein